MATTIFRSSNGRLGAAVAVLSFLILEAAIGGRALGAVVQTAIDAQTFVSQPLFH